MDPAGLWGPKVYFLGCPSLLPPGGKADRPFHREPPSKCGVELIRQKNQEEGMRLVPVSFG